MREQRPKFIYKFLEPYLDRKSIKILDIGGYNGHNITGFRGEGRKLYVLDPGAKAQYEDIIYLDSYEQALANGPYNLIVCTHVYEHLINPRDSLIEQRRLLEPNGLFYIEVPYELFIAVRKRNGLSEHINFFGRTSLKNLFCVNGFNMLTLKCRRYRGVYFSETRAFCGIYKKMDDKRKMRNRLLSFTKEVFRFILFAKILGRENLL